MRNRGLIIAISVIVTLLCIYFLSFTFVADGIQEDATNAATTNGKVNPDKKQAYLDSIYDKPAFNLLGIDYTYKEVKELELALGLDLQGGMHVTLEVSPIDILKGLAGSNDRDPGFVKALQQASEKQKNSQKKYTDLFYESFAESEGADKLARVFANSINRNKSIDSRSTDEQIKQMIDKEVDDAIDRSFEILRTRIDKFGAIQPNLQKIPGTGRILVELPGVENPQRVRNLLQGTAQLEFLEVYHPWEIADPLNQINNYLMSIKKDKDSVKTNVDELAADTTNKGTSDGLAVDGTSDTTKSQKDAVAKNDSTAADSIKNQMSEFFSLLVAGGRGEMRYNIKDTAKINRYLAMPKIQALIPSNLTFFWEKKAKKSDDGKETMELIPCKKGKSYKAPLTGDAITDARFGVSQDGNGYEISMQMNSAGAKKWKKLTAEASQDARAKRRIAIVLDDYCYSAPYVQGEIPNGNSSITGDFDFEEAKDLANVLKAGKLPARVRIVEEVIVGPSLGKESIAAGLSSLLIGLLVVVVFMVLYYNKAGLVADIALFFNVLFTMGILASYNSVLTLPGIAGIVLTLGMSIDANVLIFERIKEELRAGKPLEKAIELGYDKAFSSIFDSNITSLLTGIILYFLGSGPIKGFALTLMIGIACSFFTAVFISKVIMLYLTKGKSENAMPFTTGLSKNLFQNLNFNLIGKRKIAYIASSTILILGLVSIIVQDGLNLGVDFKGGRSYVVEFNKPVVASDIKTALSDDFKGISTEVKTFGSDNKLKITTGYLIEDESADGDKTVESALNKGLKDMVGDNYTVLYSNKVGATVADDIKNASWQSLLFSLIGIFLYVWFRFSKWQFSLGGVVALFHDAMMIIAIFSIMRMIGVPFEIDQVFVAAILTIVGFSINDTVIVFDRIREVLGTSKKELDSVTKNELSEMINQALNFTLSRTIMTTFTVLIAVIILFLFGGETLKGFSFAMLIGVVFGSYSTLFIAVPIVVDFWKTKVADNTAPVVEKTGKEKAKK